MKNHLTNIFAISWYIIASLVILFIIYAMIQIFISPDFAEARMLAFHLFIAILILAFFALIIIGLGAMIYFIFLIIKKLWK